MAHDVGAFGDEQAWRRGHGCHAAVHVEAHVVGQGLAGFVRRQVLQLHEVGDERLTLRDVLRIGVELHPLRELHAGCPGGAGRQDASALASRIGNDGVTVDQQRGLDQSDGFRLVHLLGGDQADGGAVKDRGVLHQRHAGEALVEGEQIRHRVVRELERLNHVAIDLRAVVSAGIGQSAAFAAREQHATAGRAAKTSHALAASRAVRGLGRAFVR